MEMDSDKPSEAALLKMLEIQWQDHFQDRAQTWKSLEIAAPMIVALVALDWSLKNPLATVVAASLLVFVAWFGMAITIKHRKVEIQKFKIIQEVENRLGLGMLVPGRALPEPISIRFIFRLRQSNNPLFMLRMQFIIFLFAVAYFAVRMLDLIRG